MEENNNIVDELKQMNSPLAAAPRSMPYVIPDGYFDNLTNDIKAEILLQHLSKTSPFAVPEGYFAGFADELNNKINEAAETAITKTALPYTVPQGYFNTLPGQVLSSIKASGSPAKIISIRTEIWQQVRWAAAAILLFGLGLGGFRLYVRQHDTMNPDTALSQTPKSEVSLYVEENIDDFDTEMLAGNITATDIQSLTKQLDEKDIEQYLNETE